MFVRYDNIGDTFRDLLDSFTDREQILALFNEFLSAARPGKLSLLAIKGNGGAGKTFLPSYLDERICPELGWQTCRISFAEADLDFRFLLDAIGDALERYVPHDSFERYTAECNEFIRSFDAYHATLAIQQKVEAKDLSSISNVHQSVYVDAQLQERALQLRYELTRALKRLARVMQRPLCLFIDSLNSVTGGTAEIHNWFWRDLLPGIVKAASFSALTDESVSTAYAVTQLLGALGTSVAGEAAGLMDRLSRR